MDFPVEATVHLNKFRDETEVRTILRSHGFETKDLGGGQVRVKGRFFKLKDTKDELDQLLRSQTQRSPNSSSAVPAASSGAVPKNYGPRVKAPHASPSSPTSSSSAPGSSHSRPASPLARRGSLRRDVSFVIEADVFRYAYKFKNNDIRTILVSHGVEMNQEERGDTVSIALKGRNSNSAMSKLQSLMDELSKSLRTQEVPLEDMPPIGRQLLERIQRNRNVDGAVLVCQTPDRLHLIGSSSESYELKQRLLGRTSERAGRTSAKSSRGRSSSAPPVNRKSTEAAADRNPSPGGATCYSPWKYQDDKRGADHGWGRGPAQSRENKDAEVVNGNKQEEESKSASQKFPGKLKNLMNLPANMKQKLQNAKWR